MSDGPPPTRFDGSDAAWAHNRWPTVGIYTGAGTGLVLGVTLFAGILWTIAYIVGLAILGGVCGFVAAAIVYRNAGGDPPA